MAVIVHTTGAVISLEKKSMEKILLVVFGSAPAPNAVNFACYLAGLTRSRLSGLFMEQQLYADEPVMKKPFGLPYAETIVSGDLPEVAANKRATEENMRIFTNTCEGKGVRVSAQRLPPSPINELVEESRYADLIIIDAAASCSGKQEDLPSSFVKELLAAAQCPVMIAPVATEPLEEIVFCYDGSASSLFAMKQFIYLFPELDAARGTILQVKKEQDISTAEKKRLMHWLSHHYSYTDIVTLKGNTEDELFSYLLKKNT